MSRMKKAKIKMRMLPYKKKLYEEELKEEMRTRGLHYFTLELEKLGIKLKNLTDIADHINIRYYKAAYNREWLRLVTEQRLFKNNADAQYILGRMYDNGQGVPQSYKEALKWYRLAAKHGNAEAKKMIGREKYIRLQ